MIKTTAGITPRKSERGSVLVLIFVAIALFAALSFAIGQMLRTNSPEDISAEKATLFAAELTNYALQMREATQNARITSNCDETQISFANAIVSGFEHTPAAPEDCQIFHQSKGYIQYLTPPEDWLDTEQSGQATYRQWLFSGRGCIDQMGSSDDDCHTTNGENEQTNMHSN